jgi:alanyl-tRNA synthetase
MLKAKKGVLSIDDWITGMQAHGIPADKISEVSKTPIPGGLYYEIALRMEKTAKKQEKILYNTIHLAETDNIYFSDAQCMEFDGSILEVFANVTQKNIPNILILDRSAIYPTSGGQQHDNGTLSIEGIETPV